VFYEIYVYEKNTKYYSFLYFPPKKGFCFDSDQITKEIKVRLAMLTAQIARDIYICMLLRM